MDGPPPPRQVSYDPITGIPSEYNSFLPANCDEYRRWKASQEASTSEIEDPLSRQLKLQEGGTAQIEKRLPGGKVRMKQKPEIIIERNTRNKKKCITTVSGRNCSRSYFATFIFGYAVEA
jgi:density-regulated protein